MYAPYRCRYPKHVHCVVIIIFRSIFSSPFFFVSFRSEFFQSNNRNRTRFPPAAPGRSSEASDTSHTSLSVTVWVSGSRRFVSELLDLRPAGRPYIKHIAHTHTHTYTTIIHTTDKHIHTCYKTYAYAAALFRQRRRAQFQSNCLLFAVRRWPDRWPRTAFFPTDVRHVYTQYYNMHIILLPNREYFVIFFFYYHLFFIIPDNTQFLHEHNII